MIRLSPSILKRFGEWDTALRCKEMRLEKEDILYEDKNIIVCHKRAGIATQTSRPAEPDMVSILKNYLKTPYVAVVHRLDQPVEGLLVFAKTRAAAGGLSEQNRCRMMGKYYYAAVILRQAKEREIHTLSDYLKKDGKANISRVVGRDEEGGRRSVLSYQIIKILPEEKEGDLACGLLRIELETGRHHQIRVQLAHAGMPLLGDGKYGSEESKRISREKGLREVALCCCQLEFRHPATGKELSFHIQPRGQAFASFFQ